MTTLTSDPKGFYRMLGVQPRTGADELKAAWRRRAKELHPDLNPHRDTKPRFQALAEAWRVLSNPHRRAVYDRFGR